MNAPTAAHLSSEKLDTILPSPSSASLSDGNQLSDIFPLEKAQPIFKPTRGFLLAFASICIITLAAALDATSLSIALPIITEKLGGTAIEAFWSGTSFLLTSAVFQPVIAGLSHVFGRKELMLASIVFFFVGSVVSALAKNFTMMLVGRSIQGIGGGGIMSLGEILVTDLVPLAVRGAWFGYLGSMWAIGSVTGPLMGGAFAQNVSWRWIFWINVPIIAIGTVAIVMFLRLNKTTGGLGQKVKNFDWLGSVFFVASSVSFLIPLTWGGIMYSWTSWRTLFPLIIGVAGNYAHYISRNTHSLIHGIVLWSLLYFLPLYYEAVQDYTPIISGVAILPETSFVAPMSVVVGIICAKTGHYRWAIYTGWLLTTIGAGILILLGPSTSIVSWIFLNVPISIGTGMLFPAMALAIQAAGRQEDAGHAAAFYSFTRVFGQSLGVAVGGVIFQNQIKIKLLSYELLAPMADAYSKDATALVGIIKLMEEGLEKTQLVQAYADALKMIWVVMCALSAVGLVGSLATKGYSLDQEHKTLQGYKEQEALADPEKTLE
ncbi:hypothetical protein VTL71DRAFT_5251, partial [Oculimacula yallundae]